jgi:hypothetical protein
MKMRVYLITDTNETMRYIGSTKQTLSQRMTVHRSNYRRWKQSKTQNYCASFQLFDECGIENCQILMLYEMEGDSKDAIRIIEHRYIKEMDCVNKRGAYRSEEQLRNYQLIYQPKYRAENREKLKAYARTRITCECGIEVSRGFLPTHRHTEKHRRFLSAMNNLATTL